MDINLKYKIEERDSHNTLSIIREYGTDVAMNLAYEKGVSVIDNDEDSILTVILLAWSMNLSEDSKKEELIDRKEELRILSGFFRTLAHKLYRYQRKKGTIGVLTMFLQSVE